MNRSGLLSLASRGRDAAFAVALCALGEAELFGHEKYNHKPVWPGPAWANAVVIAALTLPFLWRRRHPLATVLTVLTILTASTLTLGGSEAATTFVVLIAAVFSGTAHSRHVLVVLTAAVIASAAHGLNDPSSEGIADVTWTYGLVAIAALLGRAVWVRAHRIGVLETDAEVTAERHAHELAAATAAERASIARELHDIVSHAVSVIVIQSQVGARALPTDVDLAAESLAAIEASARTAMSELRHLLRLLTPDDEPATTTPMASLNQLDELLDRCRSAGLAVDVDGDSTAPKDPLADLAAYRVIQEALTNTMRHAPGAAARISVTRNADTLEITATDNGGSPHPDRPTTGAGRGLIGMRERLALVGGNLAEAAHHSTGYRLRAVVPLREQNPQTSHSPT
jgi:signal transduction histidine kinase